MGADSSRIDRLTWALDDVGWLDGPMFGYERSVIEANPTVHAGVIHARGLANEPSPGALRDAYRAEQARVRERIGVTPVAEHPSILAWRRAFTRFGTKPTQYRSAAESLLRRLDKQGDIPSINILVDIGNLVSIRHAVPVAVFDLGGVEGGIVVRHSNGAEPFTDLGSDEVTHPDPGEVVFVDRSEVVCARRWCWRQSAQSATSGATTEALFVTEALHETAENDVAAAVRDLTTLLAEYQKGARLGSFHLSAANPAVGPT